MSEVEEIKNRLSVVDLVGEYIRLTKAGSNWRALCPFHNEKTPSFMVSDERHSWHCFGCQKGGDIFSFVMEMEGIGFREALELLAPKAGVTLKKWEAGDEKLESNKKKLYQILELATKWYEKNLWDGKGKDKILKYLRERGLTDESIKKFRLGYAPDGWRNLLEFLGKKKFDVSDIAKTGLLVEKETDLNSNIPATRHRLPTSKYYDRFRDRIMFPVQDITGRVVGFSARVAPGGDEKNAKYINTPQTALYDKSRVLYGMNLAKTEIRKRDEAVLVEGNTDVIACHQAGFGNTIAVSGTALTLEQIKIIRRYSENLKMAYDMDVAGQSAARKSARICLENDLNVNIVLLPSGKDAAEIIKSNPKIWGKAVEDAREVVDYFFEDAFLRFDGRQPAGKKKIAQELLSVIKDIASPVVRSHWIKTLGKKLGIDEKILIGILKKVETLKKVEPGRDVPEEKERAGSGNMLGKRLIGLILAFPSETAKRAATLKRGLLPIGIEVRILESLEAQSGKKSLEIAKQQIGDYEASKYMDEAVFEIEVESQTRNDFDPVKELGEAIQRLNLEKIKVKVQGLYQDIKKAEAAGDKKALNGLMQEFQDLSEELKK